MVCRDGTQKKVDFTESDGAGPMSAMQPGMEWCFEFRLVSTAQVTSPALAQQLRLPGTKEGTDMLYYALAFLLVGLVAGALGLFGVAAIASQIAWILFLVGIVILIVHLVAGRGARIP